LHIKLGNIKEETANSTKASKSKAFRRWAAGYSGRLKKERTKCMASELKARNGIIFGSDAYFEKLNKEHFGLTKTPSKMKCYEYKFIYTYVLKNIGYNDEKELKQTLKKLAKDIITDIKRGNSCKDNRYVKDEYGDHILKALNQIKWVLGSLVDYALSAHYLVEICWTVKADPKKVEDSKTNLRELGYFHGDMDDLFDKDLNSAFKKFFDDLLNSDVLQMAEINANDATFLEEFARTLHATFVTSGDMLSDSIKLVSLLKNMGLRGLKYGTDV